MRKFEARGFRAAFRMGVLDDDFARGAPEPAHIRRLWSDSHQRFITLKVTPRAMELIRMVGVDEVLRRARNYPEP